MADKIPYQIDYIIDYATKLKEIFAALQEKEKQALQFADVKFIPYKQYEPYKYTHIYQKDRYGYHIEPTLEDVEKELVLYGIWVTRQKVIEDENKVIHQNNLQLKSHIIKSLENIGCKSTYQKYKSKKSYEQ